MERCAWCKILQFKFSFECTQIYMANIFFVPHILLLAINKSAKYEKLEKYWSYCTQNRAITSAYSTEG